MNTNTENLKIVIVDNDVLHTSYDGSKQIMLKLKDESNDIEFWFEIYISMYDSEILVELDNVETIISNNYSVPELEELLLKGYSDTSTDTYKIFKNNKGLRNSIGFEQYLKAVTKLVVIELYEIEKGAI